MTLSIHTVMADSAIVALTLRQPLASVEASEVPVAPPTYPPARETGAHRFDTPYPVNETRDGVRLCDLDSVQSQANRMEAAFGGELADVIPRHVVRAGRFERDLTALPHRIADAAIRATALEPRIRAAFEAFESGRCGADGAPRADLARLRGVGLARDARSHPARRRIDDSRPRRLGAHPLVGLLRRLRARRARARCEGVEEGGGRGARPHTRVDRPGGILVHGAIVQSASVVLAGLRGYRTSDGSEVLPAYLLGLALGGS